MNFVLICCVQNVESCERMLGLEVGPARPSFLVGMFSLPLRVHVRETHAAALLRAAQAEHRLQPRKSRPLEFWSQLPGNSVVP